MARQEARPPSPSPTVQSGPGQQQALPHAATGLPGLCSGLRGEGRAEVKGSSWRCKAGAWGNGNLHHLLWLQGELMSRRGRHSMVPPLHLGPRA